MPEPNKKMKPCRMCGKDVAVDDESNSDFVHDCGWAESQANAKLRAEELMEQMREERKKQKAPAKRKSIFD